LDGGGRWLQVAACHLLLTAAVFSVSQEVALAFLAGLATYWLLEYQAGSKGFAYVAAVHLGVMACFAMLAPRAAFLSIRVFSSGGSALPLFPSPYLLFYVGSLLVVIVPVLAGAVRAAQGQGRSSGAFGTLTAAFAVQAVAMIPAALGRADAGHVLYNGTGVFLLALLAPSRRRSPPDSPAPHVTTVYHTGVAIRRRWVYPMLFFLIFPVMTLAISGEAHLDRLQYLAKLGAAEWGEEHPSSALTHSVEKTLGEEEWNSLRKSVPYIRKNVLERSFPGLSHYGNICVPFGEPDVYFVLARHHVLQAEYYYSISLESPAPEVHRKIDDMRSCAYAILPGYALASPPPLQPLDMDYYSRLLLFPFLGPPRIPPPSPEREFFNYLRVSFVPVQEPCPGLFLCRQQPGGLP
jgi:hypothetical protein